LLVYDVQRNKKLFWKLEKLHFPFNNSVVVIVTFAATVTGVLVAVLVVTKASRYGLFQCFSTSGLWTTAKCTDIVTTGKFYSLIFFERVFIIFWDVVLCGLVEVYCSFRRTYCLHLQGQIVSQASRVFTPSDTPFRKRQAGPYYIFSVLSCVNIENIQHG
jgi:hypothetical protein